MNTFLGDSKHLHKERPFSRNVLSTNDCISHFIFSLRRKAKGQGYYLSHKNARWSDLDWLTFKIKSGIEKIYQVLYTFHYNKYFMLRAAGERKRKKICSTQIKQPAHWYLFSLHEVIWAGWIPVESTLYSQCLLRAWDVCHSQYFWWWC